MKQQQEEEERKRQRKEKKKEKKVSAVLQHKSPPVFIFQLKIITNSLVGFENQQKAYSLDIKWFQREQATQHEPEDVDPDIAAMMGFGGFGSSKK